MGGARNVALWAVSVLLAGLYVALAGFGKVTGVEEVADNFRAWGYGDAFRVLIGLCEIVGGIGLLIPPLATWAAGGLGIIMLGAIYTHVANDAPNVVVPIVLVVLLALVAYARRDRALFLAGAGGSDAGDTTAT